MKTRIFAFAVAALVAFQTALAQAPATPGPEHELLKKFEGTWNCKVKMADQEETSTGTATYKMELGGLWLTSTFQSEFFGQKFEGRGFETYDATSKKFYSVWADSMSSKPFNLEGTYDKEKKTFTQKGEAPDGSMMKSVTTFKSDDQFTFTMYMVAGGQDQKVMSIEYTRKK